jgi:hypothetical protein
MSGRDISLRCHDAADGPLAAFLRHVASQAGCESAASEAERLLEVGVEWEEVEGSDFFAASVSPTSSALPSVVRIPSIGVLMDCLPVPRLERRISRTP